MLIFAEEKLTYLAVPKTGSTAVEAKLAPRATSVLRNPPAMKHMPLYRYNRFLVPLLNKTGHGELETVAVVRNPIDWVGSWYRYRKREDLKNTPNSTLDMNFEEFLTGYLQEKQPAFAKVGSQSHFLTRNGKLRPTHLFQYEEFPAFIASMEERLCQKIELSRHNVSPLEEMEATEETLQRFEEKYALDFELWERASR
ncbi:MULTISPECIES: sulfotransferase family protein [Halocynthiibacter]|uniref:Sulfotransferase family protein n=1 Tax=Halocynthiibacter halioticoli TaxID=2986804 RepID=A0AAE3J352_9RHOB|nr:MULTISPECIES: sulfotransferase family protein [Halocynthiibacter]MCV6824462.1 sulfotransferase family protein [Halocynthiibacter halioticoli]MCW4057463.1 sulfotransferase family protein [Halocynthiibacter sp. SDUM655004]